jgi:hypothetical protein
LPEPKAGVSTTPFFPSALEPYFDSTLPETGSVLGSIFMLSVFFISSGNFSAAENPKRFPELSLEVKG